MTADELGRCRAEFITLESVVTWAANWVGKLLAAAERVQELEADRDSESRWAKQYLDESLKAKADADDWRECAEKLADAMQQVSAMLTIPAAEYVPAIGETYPIMDAALAEYRRLAAKEGT